MSYDDYDYADDYDYEKTPLHEAKSTEEISRLIDSKIDVDVRDRDLNTPLHWLVDDYDKAKFLIEKGANVNARNIDYYTPLHSCRKIECVKLLIENNANVDAEGIYNSNVLDNKYDNIEILEFLLDKISVDNGKSLILLFENIDEYDVDHVKKIVQLHINNGIDFNSLDFLHTIVKSTKLLQSYDVIEMLLENGANINKRDSTGNTPLCYSKNKAMAMLLLLNGAKMYKRCKKIELLVDAYDYLYQ